MKMKIDVWAKERARLYNTFAYTSASTNSFHKICERNFRLHYILRLTLGNFGPFVINHSTPMSKWLKKSKCLGFLCGFPLLKILEMSKTTRISNTFWGFHIFKQLKYLKIFENNLKFSRFSEVSSDSVFQPREYCRSLGVSNLVVILNCQPITMMTLTTIWIST